MGAIEEARGVAASPAAALAAAETTGVAPSTTIACPAPELPPTLHATAQTARVPMLETAERPRARTSLLYYA